MIIASSISTASQPVRAASTENVGITVVATYELTTLSPSREERIAWGIELTNSIAVVPSGETISIKLTTNYEVYNPATKTSTPYSQASSYDVTAVLGSVNISTPVTGASDFADYPSGNTITVTSQTLLLLTPASNPYTAGDQTWNFTL